MHATTTANPYEPSSHPNDAASSGLTQMQSGLAALLSVWLLIRGSFMIFSWVMQLSSGFQLDSHFHAASFVKDAIYGVTAFVGGAMLLARRKLGWWAALVHWCWYVACEIIVVIAAATLGWRVPVHHEPPKLYGVIGLTTLLSAFGFSILLWRPIATAYNAPISKCHAIVVVVMTCSVIIAFSVNWWMSLR